MKDEEMAEEYKEKHICNTCADIQECGNDCPFSRCAVQGFLAGLKAGKPQWYKVADGDLPKEYDITQKAFGIWEERRDTHIVQNQDGERVCCLNGKWYYEEGGEAYVIAWCEIPTFDKE